MKERGFTKKDTLGLKGIAILMLLFYHLFRQSNLFSHYGVDFFPFTQKFVISIAVMCKICVSIFAFISGYGLLKSIKKIKLNRKETAKWNVSRLISTMSGFYFVYIISFIVTMLIDGYPYETYFKFSTTEGIVYSLIDFLGLSNLFATPTMLVTWWYMSAAIIFILIVPIVYNISKKTGYLPVLLLIIMVPRVLNIGYPGGQSPYTFILPMVLGMIFADYDLFEKISDFLQKKKAIYLAAFFILGFLLIFYYYIYCNIEYWNFWEIEQGILPVLVICFCRYFIIRIPILKGGLGVLGKYSMNIFLTHNFIREVYLNKFTYSFHNFIIIYIFLIVVSLVLAIVLELIKKVIRYDIFIDKVKNKILKRIDNIVIE